MNRTVSVLLLSAMLLLVGGWFLYNLGSEINLKVGLDDQLLWEEAPGDKWLYIGGLMMLISGSLGAAAVRVWIGAKRSVSESTFMGAVSNKGAG